MEKGGCLCLAGRTISFDHTDDFGDLSGVERQSGDATTKITTYDIEFSVSDTGCVACGGTLTCLRTCRTDMFRSQCPALMIVMVSATSDEKDKRWCS